MQPIGQGDVDKIDFGVAYNFFIASISLLETVLLGAFLCLLIVARADSVKDDIWVGFCGMYN